LWNAFPNRVWERENERIICRTIDQFKGKLWGYYRYRIGDYRMVYLIDEQTNQVLVDTIAHRGKVYD
jgi:mRNA-degrading endonuclease RelE of RelBE toxin-antitoxin system